MKITKKGQLEIYSIGIDKVPTKWELDLKHEECIAKDNINGTDKNKSYEWCTPSRWRAKGEGMNAKIVDHLVI